MFSKQTFSNFERKPLQTQKQVNKTFAGEKKETLEVLPQATQSKNLQALIARMGSIRAHEWIAVDLLPVIIQSL